MALIVQDFKVFVFVFKDGGWFAFDVKGGRHPVSPTGVLAKGGKTRRPRKPSNTAIIRRRKSVRYGQLKLK